jgi:transcriptional regulator with XRE-family HTH domain
MAGHEKRDERAQRLAREALAIIGREIRIARLTNDLSQHAASRAIGPSKSSWSRIERGEALHVPLVDLARALAVVGLDFHVRSYPGGPPVRDAAHLQLLERLRTRLGPGVRWRTEVPLPAAGDRRAWDALILAREISVGVEAETRAGDAQGLQRRVALKRRDGGVDHVLLLADTRHHRIFLKACGEGFLADFPIAGRVALSRLAEGVDPGGSAIVLL